MLIVKGIYLLAAFACAVCQLPTDAETKSSIALNVIEMRQVMRDSDPTGKNHSIKVVLSPYQPLQHLVEWELILMKNNVPTVYSLKGDGQDFTTQTELVFEGNLVEAEIVTILAKNATNYIGISITSAPIKDLKSDVAWVGDFQTGKSASLRVSPGEKVNKVMVGRHSCEYSQSPCYYITPNPRPANIERCYSPFTQFKLCDDRVISFKEPSSLPAIFLQDKFLEVEVLVTKQLPVMEVVAYDIQDHKKVLSDFPYRCLFPMGSEWNEGEKIRCRVSLTLPANTTNMMVLVVTLDEEGDVLESSLQVYRDHSPLPPSTNAGAIVGAVFGTLIGLALIVLVVICCLKKADEKRAKTERGGSAVYKTTTTTDPAEA